jgi:hypothetical protein
MRYQPGHVRGSKEEFLTPDEQLNRILYPRIRGRFSLAVRPITRTRWMRGSRMEVYFAYRYFCGLANNLSLRPVDASLPGLRQDRPRRARPNPSDSSGEVTFGFRLGAHMAKGF